jgi:hypothetical protein
MNDLMKRIKIESQVRSQLSQMGWKNTQDQNAVFEAIAAVQDIKEYRRSS